MSKQTLTLMRHKNDFAVAKPKNKAEFTRFMRLFRQRYYSMVDTTPTALWMGLGNKLVKLCFPKHDHSQEQSFSLV